MAQFAISNFWLGKLHENMVPAFRQFSRYRTMEIENLDIS